ncbi:Glucose-6-phosphate/phosphate translocator 1, chloroplastic [Gracilariopsis chorda]|uniref:Glucose-6-phosphate/phosphate translocator 1, chloroplastic n=1 Tax=Gracilariopsis chorda TaxID=448386 RepID=A0A2V3J7G7_9FLOR|nr:Glucose-6-phosphate/phosphate translocator 1, chloroplastic [Gracilariopsis chorda]|eukprot:PXF50002.1 Glucose-6-phosphate/phosphate translocator 1, chloroplastic [Gracilariopsis chorda]
MFAFTTPVVPHARVGTRSSVSITRPQHLGIAVARRSRISVSQNFPEQKSSNVSTIKMVAREEPSSINPSSGLSLPSSDTLQVGFLFFLWYVFNIIFNLMNKTVLNAWSKPWILSTVQLGVGSIMVLTQWALRLQKRPNLSFKLIRALFLPTISHLVGHVSTCISFSYVAVSFSHIVKACEPAFGALGSALVLGEVYSPGVYATLLPIISGVALSAVTQFQFSWPGFLFAMLSNLAFASRNIFSKLTMGEFKKDPTLSPQNIYGIMSVMAFMIEVPIALSVEGLSALPSSHIARVLAGSGVFYTLYNTVSFMALGKTGVVTHAVGNILKRASVIVVSIFFFRTPVKLFNAVGMGIALAGTFLYSIVKQRFLAKKKAEAEAKSA